MSFRIGTKNQKKQKIASITMTNALIKYMQNKISKFLFIGALLASVLALVVWAASPVTDTFTDETKIASKTNIFVDTTAGQVKLAESCPTGFIPVPGDATYGTSNFCVMQYEAKYDCTGDEDGDSAATCSAVADSGAGLDWRDVTQNSSYVVSTANGAPIVHITHTQALSACPSDSHLITNDEWMTIARNAEQVAGNWTNGSVGSGCLFRGNSRDTTCGYDAGTDPESGTDRNVRAKFTLSNGEEIWDVSGNVWEHMRRDEADTLTDSLPNDGGASGWRWIEFPAITSYGELSYDIIRPSVSSWNANYGVGRLYTNSAVQSQRVFIRGGDWRRGAHAGAFSLTLTWDVSDQNYDVGFRCAR